MKCENCCWFWYDEELERECCHFDEDGSYSALGIPAPCEEEDYEEEPW